MEPQRTATRLVKVYSCSQPILSAGRRRCKLPGMVRTEIQCPAGEIVHPVLSPNRDDVQCRIQGGLRPARTREDAMGRSEPVVCTGDYTKCRIWRTHVQIDRGPSTKKQRDQTLSNPHRHALTGRHEREKVRA